MHPDYQHYQEENFMMDEFFQGYCFGKDPVATRFWNDWLQRHPEKAAVVEKARQMLLFLSGGNDPDEFRRHEQIFREQFRNHLQPSPQEPDQPPAQLSFFRRPSVLKRILWSVSLAVIAGVFFVIYQPGNKQQTVAVPADITSKTAYGEHKSFRLKDGTLITLNAGSRITVLPGFNGNLREIKLEGEAFLDVAHNPEKPFVIHTASMDVRVLGTILNVKAYPGDKKAEASLIRGMIEVDLPGDHLHKIVLHPNQKIIVDQLQQIDAQEKSIAPKTSKDNNYMIRQLEAGDDDSTVNEILWTKSKLVFEDRSLEEIAVELERAYGVEVSVASEIKEYRYAGTFESKNIEDVLKALQLSRHFTYHIENGKKILITNQ